MGDWVIKLSHVVIPLLNLCDEKLLAGRFILKKAVGFVARALKMLKMEYFFVKFWRSR